MESLFCSNERKESFPPPPLHLLKITQKNLFQVVWELTQPTGIVEHFWCFWQQMFRISLLLLFSLTKYSQINATKIVLVERRPSHTALSGFCLFLNILKIQTALKNLRHSLSSGFIFYLVILSKRHA